jgi:hypothetical protein
MQRAGKPKDNTNGNGQMEKRSVALDLDEAKKTGYGIR